MEKNFQYELQKVDTFHALDFYIKIWIYEDYFIEREIAESIYYKLGGK